MPILIRMLQLHILSKTVQMLELILLVGLEAGMEANSLRSQIYIGKVDK